ncbi:MAG: hypothetical protein WBK28_03615 [Minisyncoccia bacterium]
MTSSPRTRGFLTLELLLATAFFVLAMTGVFLLAAEGQTSGLDVGLGSGGIANARTALENTSEDATELSRFTTLADKTDTVGIYAVTQNVEHLSPCLKILFEETTWGSENNRTGQVGLSTFVSSVETARFLGGGCDPIPPGAWDNPDSLGDADIGGSTGTGVAVRSLGGARMALLTANPAAAAQEDFFVFNVEDPTTPDERARLDVGAGLNGIVVGGVYAYVLEDDNIDQLKVITLADPDAPAVVATLSLPNIVFTCTPAASPCQAGRSIAYYDERVYVGTGYLAFGGINENHEFHVFDVSNPTAPSWQGSVNVNHNVNDIVVSGDYAYLATSDNAGELTIINLENPAAPTVLARFDAPWSAKDGTRVDIQGTTAYLGRDKASNGDFDFLSIMVADPASPTLLDSVRLSMNGAGAALTGLATQGPYAFIGTSDTNDEFRVYDISDPTNLTLHGCPPYNYSVRVRDLIYADGYVFAVNEANDALRIIYDDPDTICN